MSLKEDALKLHKELKGKISVNSKVKINNKDVLSLAYTPGVAEPCKEISMNQESVYDYTAKGNLVAVVTDGSAVLGLGDIGPYAALPVMEGKVALFKEFADVDAFPICLDTKDTEEIIRTVKLLEPTFGGINLEDISAPRCFEIEDRLNSELSIPVFHDDQHGTAIVVLAGIINSLKLTNKDFSNLKIVINGSGAAGIAITKILLSVGVKDILLLDSKGIISRNRIGEMNWIKDEMAKMTNKDNQDGDLAFALKNADIFVGVSKGGILNADMIKSMNNNQIIFALANPTPEIDPALAKEAGALIIGTGRSDYPNQINNVLAFPGVFRGALDGKAKCINESMKLAAAYSISNLVSNEELSPEYIIPNPFDDRVAKVVSEAVKKAAMDSLVCRS